VLGMDFLGSLGCFFFLLGWFWGWGMDLLIDFEQLLGNWRRTFWIVSWMDFRIFWWIFESWDQPNMWTNIGHFDGYFFKLKLVPFKLSVV
jgi:hypothetical protein